MRRGDADAMLCGTRGNFADHLRYVRNVIGLRDGVKTLAAMQMLILPGRQLFICDTHVNRDPSAEQIAEMTLLAAEEVRRFGMKPSVALLSHSSFGSSDAPSARRCATRWRSSCARAPDLAVEGEMRADAALSKTIRDQRVPGFAPDRRTPTCSIMPNVDAANITYNALRVTAGGGITVGGILLGAAKPVHIMTPSSTVRRIVNMTAVAVADAGAQRDKHGARLTERADVAAAHAANELTEETHGKPRKKPLYKSLYFQVIVAIVIGVLLGHFYPETGDGDEAARRRLHQADQDDHRADHLLHGRRRHRRHGGHEEGRQDRRLRAALLRDRQHRSR